MQIKIHNIETDEIIEREMTAEELKQYEKDQKFVEDMRKNEADRIAKREALLQKLGITQEEAEILLS